MKAKYCKIEDYKGQKMLKVSRKKEKKATYKE